VIRPLSRGACARPSSPNSGSDWSNTNRHLNEFIEEHNADLPQPAV